MSEYKKLAHAVWQCKYHIAFCPKYRFKILKGKCAIKMFDRHLDLKKRYWGNHFWARGYCVDTVGLDADKICKYVKYQEAQCQSAFKIDPSTASISSMVLFHGVVNTEGSIFDAVFSYKGVIIAR